jgi:hypothetical protein
VWGLKPQPPDTGQRIQPRTAKDIPRVIVPIRNPPQRGAGYALPVTPFGKRQYSCPPGFSNRSPIIKIGMHQHDIQLNAAIASGVAPLIDLPLSGKAVMFQSLWTSEQLSVGLLTVAGPPSGTIQEPAQIWEIGFDKQPAEIQFDASDMRSWDSIAAIFVRKSQPSLFLNGFSFGSIQLQAMLHNTLFSVNTLLRIITWEEPLGQSSFIYEGATHVPGQGGGSGGDPDSTPYEPGSQPPSGE